MDKKKILIADDEKEILDLICKKLREHDYEVAGVLESGDIIEQCEKFKPDLIILDIVMPGKDGYTVASELKENKKLTNIPIVFLTTKDLEFQGIQKRTEDLNASGYLAKPCTFEDILKKIKELIG